MSDYLELAHAMLVLDRFQEYERSAGLFLDYWIGPGALAQLEPETRNYVVGTISRVADDWLEISQHTPGQCRVADFAGLSMPALLVCGERTRSAARAIVECLLKTIPEAEYREIPAAGHLSPITHPEAVNKEASSCLPYRRRSGPCPGVPGRPRSGGLPRASSRAAAARSCPDHRSRWRRPGPVSLGEALS